MPDNNKETHLTYQQKKSIDYTLRLREVLSELPPFCKDYFDFLRKKDFRNM